MIGRLFEFVRYGSAAGETRKGRMLGLWLYWRTWAMVACFVAGAFVAGHYAPSADGANGWAIGVLTGIIALHVGGQQ